MGLVFVGIALIVLEAFYASNYAPVAKLDKARDF